MPGPSAQIRGRPRLRARIDVCAVGALPARALPSVEASARLTVDGVKSGEVLGHEDGVGRQIVELLGQRNTVQMGEQTL